MMTVSIRNYKYIDLESFKRYSYSKTYYFKERNGIIRLIVRKSLAERDVIFKRNIKKNDKNSDRFAELLNRNMRSALDILTVTSLN